VDVSGNTNDGWLVSAAATNWGEGVLHGALALTGSNYVQLADSETLAPSGLTLAMWIDPAADLTNGAAVLFSKKDPAAATGYSLAVTNGKLEWLICQAGVHVLTAPVVLTNGAWRHVAATYGAGRQRIYVDGVQAAETNWSMGTSMGYLDQGTTAPRIGASTDATPARFFPGLVDDVRLYDGEFTSNQVWSIYEAGADLDGDTLRPAAEMAAGSSPSLLDTDGDRLEDREDPNPKTADIVEVLSSVQVAIDFRAIETARCKVGYHDFVGAQPPVVYLKQTVTQTYRTAETNESPWMEWVGTCTSRASDQVEARTGMHVGSSGWAYQEWASEWGRNYHLDGNESWISNRYSGHFEEGTWEVFPTDYRITPADWENEAWSEGPAPGGINGLYPQPGTVTTNAWSAGETDLTKAAAGLESHWHRKNEFVYETTQLMAAASQDLDEALPWTDLAWGARLQYNWRISSPQKLEMYESECFICGNNLYTCRHAAFGDVESNAAPASAMRSLTNDLDVVLRRTQYRIGVPNAQSGTYYSARVASVFTPRDSTNQSILSVTNHVRQCTDPSTNFFLNPDGTSINPPQSNGTVTILVVQLERIYVSYGDAANALPGYDHEAPVRNYLIGVGATYDPASNAWIYDDIGMAKRFEVRTVGEAGFIQALQTTGSYVGFRGHSNYGIGLAWNNTCGTLAAFLNAGTRNAGVSWDGMIEQQPSLTIADSDIALGPTNFVTSLAYERFINYAGTFEGQTVPEVGVTAPSNVFTHVYGVGQSRFHYFGESSNQNRRIMLTVRPSGGNDMPPLRYKWLLLDSCYSGLYYGDTFTHGVFFYTTTLEYLASDSMKRLVQAVIEGWAPSQFETALDEMDDELGHQTQVDYEFREQ
jgi:hypothetical protein